MVVVVAVMVMALWLVHPATVILSLASNQILAAWLAHSQLHSQNVRSVMCGKVLL